MPSDSFLDQIKAFGARLGLPKIDVDKLVEMNRKNFEALMRSASVAGEGAKALAEKQREIVQAAFNETSAMVKDFRPTGSPQEIVAKQSEYAKKAFEVAMQNMRDLAELATKTTSEAAGIVRERVHDNRFGRAKPLMVAAQMALRLTADDFPGCRPASIS